MRLTRRRNLARLVSGLYRARHVHLSKVADEVAGRRRLLVAALAYRRRALSIRWRVDRAMGVTGASLQRRFAQELAALVPKAADVMLIGDGEFHCVELLREARQLGWDFCVRLHADTYVRGVGGQSEAGNWQECRTFDPAEGRQRYLEEICVTKKMASAPYS